MIDCWLAVEPVKAGSSTLNMELQPPPSPARSASRLSWPHSLVVLDVFAGTESSVRIV